MLRRLPLAAVLWLLLAPPAGAAWFPGEPIDGPSDDILALGDVDVARDGTGAVVYLKREHGAAHVFLSRLIDGAWRAPERVDINIHDEATAASIAVADGNQLAVVWTAGGRLYGSSYPRVEATAPLPLPQLLSHGPAADPHVDLGLNGTAYGVFTADGGDVRAVRLRAGVWEAVPEPLDIEPAREAGTGAGRPRVAVAADGNAVVVWGETAGEGRRLFARRLTGLTLSAVPQEVSLPELEGAAGGEAQLADVDTEDDGSYAWAVFRQDFGGTPRAVARRLVGSQWEAPVPIDAGGPAGAPRVAISGRGVGAATVRNVASGAVHAPLLELDAFSQAWPIADDGALGTPVVTASERDDQAFAWLAGDPAVPSVLARRHPARSAFEPAAAISHPAYGGVVPEAGLEAAESRLGDVAVAFVQAGGEGRRLMAAVWDRPPARPALMGASIHHRHSRARLRWRPSLDLWGDQLFRVFVDDVEVASTTEDRVRLPEPLRDGLHRWRVVAADRRGQEAPSRSRLLRIDSRDPRVRVQVAAGGTVVSVRARARDPRGGSGLDRIVIHWGDGTRSLGPTAAHRYRRRGRVKLTVRAIDRAGNVGRRAVRLRIA